MKAWRGLGTADDVADDATDLAPLRAPVSEPSSMRLWIEVPVLVLIAAIVAIVVKTFLAQAFFIPSGSMEPQLTSGDRVVVSRLAYETHDPNRGDIVVFDDPLEVPLDDDSFVLERWGRDALEAVGAVRPDGIELIKRVIALPGETVEAVDGVVYIDSRVLIEPYLDDDVVITDFDAVVVPDDHVFVMGDNRTNSKDSRVFGPVPRSSIVGRAMALIWPIGRTGYL